MYELITVKKNAYEHPCPWMESNFLPNGQDKKSRAIITDFSSFLSIINKLMLYEMAYGML
jgi:hypothetical protein